ncbi:hypothetical protein Afil01_19690 [Actinorhabdospora filicis]|uniref:Secreted protein n=1 Tax=Actinorhabdospora filicis TaxID=1785913 RepID=A0A9W6SJX0_9ACTN|nr:hypothetical protein [Actinorhabdospora filicis]GLZ77162.1 hypothetical protein Afil01_19690 [Actinorhabdospora filicis]
MNRFTRRTMTIAAAGVIALSALTACGAAEQAMDCANLVSVVEGAAGAIGGDPSSVKAQSDKLREQANGIGDADLASAVNTLADSLDRLATLQDKSINNPTSLTSQEMSELSALPGKITDQVGTISGKCTDVTS